MPDNKHGLRVHPLVEYHAECVKRLSAVLEKASWEYAKTHDSAGDYEYFLQRWLEDRPTLIEDIVRGEES